MTISNLDKTIDNILAQLPVKSLAELGAQAMDDERFSASQKTEYAQRIFTSIMEKEHQYEIGNLSIGAGIGAGAQEGQ